MEMSFCFQLTQNTKQNMFSGKCYNLFCLPFQGPFVHRSALYGIGTHRPIRANSNEPLNDVIGDFVQKFNQFSASNVFRKKPVSSAENIFVGFFYFLS